MTRDTQHSAKGYEQKAISTQITSRILRREQKKLYRAFAKAFPPRPEWKVLDLGTDAAMTDRGGYFFEANYPYESGITAMGLEPGENITRLFPALTYRQTSRDTLRLPVEDQHFDLVFCNAVIEHVGDRATQRRFLEEIVRVGKKAFVTTPNRWYPVELHTVTPLLHWLPPTLYRPLYRRMGFDFFSQEQNLNLLDKDALWSMVPAAVKPRARIAHHRFLGGVSNLLLIID